MESSGDFTPYLFAETEEGATSYVTLNAFFEGDLYLGVQSSAL